MTEEPKATKSKQTKPRPKKAKDMPPPPYIDDGSHDLLQEVIAMEELEREDGSKKASSSKHTNGKRKFIDMDLDADDELLSLALDDDKRPEKSPIRHVEPEKTEPIPAPTPPPPVKILQLSQKAKKSAESSSTPPRPATVSSKGKEKEIAPPVAAPIPPKPTKKASTPAQAPPAPTPINEKKCRDILKNLTKMPQAGIFSRPVDPLHDGCPT